MHVIVVTSEWPTLENPASGSFVALQVDKLRSIGVDVDVFSFRGSMNPTRYVKAWFDLRKQLRTKPYDLIHAHFGQSGLLALPKKLPLVVTFHGSDLNGVVSVRGHTNSIAGFILREISHYVSTIANEIIVVSPKLFGSVSHPNTHLIPCGIDLSLFRPIDKSIARRELQMDEDKIYVLFGANPANPIKRYSLANNVVSNVRKRTGQDVELLAISAEPHERMPLYMNACDVLLLTSISEGSPMVVKEALACNLPIVSVDVGDVRERIAGVEGCIVCIDEQPTTIIGALSSVLLKGGRVDGIDAVASLSEDLLAKSVLDIYTKAIQ